MFQVDHCVACKSKNILQQSAELARFVAARILSQDPGRNFPITGYQCLDCSFVGSVDRFTVDEESLLYKDYRGQEYNDLRNVCEPGYLDTINLFDNGAYTEYRKIGINYLAQKHLDVTKIKNLLDYGGDTGSMIPECFTGTKKYVFDISGVVPNDGIHAYDCSQNLQFDFLMCCHVLEHKPNPDELLQAIRKLVHNNSWIYFEIPNNPNPYVGTFHEHINFFNLSSITKLLERNGFVIVDSYEYGFECSIPCHKNNLCLLTKIK